MQRETLDVRLKALHAIGRDLNSSLDLNEVLNAVMDKVIELMRVDRGFIVLGDTADLMSDHLTYQVARNFSKESITEDEMKISRSTIEKVVRTQQPVVFISGIDEQAQKVTASIIAHHIRAILCVPIQARGRRLGVIYLDNSMKAGNFNHDDLLFMETFADIAGIAVDNAQLFGDLNARIRELTGLKRYMDAIFDGGPLNTTEALANMADLKETGIEVALQEGDFLWHEGDHGSFVVLLLEGTLEVLHQASENDNEVVVLRQLGPGSVLGEMACIDNQPRSATVRAATNCLIRHLSADQFREVMRQRPDVLEKVFWQQVQRVRSLTEQVNTTHHTSITDQLTRLYNFGFFRDRLRAEIARARHTNDLISLIIFDIDHFKHYNDNNGHQEGNVCLMAVADILRQVGRKSDIVARYGGEEFVVLLYGSTREEAQRFAEAAAKKVRETHFEGGKTQPLGFVSVSGGVATYPLDADGDTTLIEAADANLYQAKESGRNRIVAAARQAAVAS